MRKVMCVSPWFRTIGLCLEITAMSSLWAVQSTYAAEICEASFKVQPDSLNNDTIYLPETAVTLAPKVFVGIQTAIDSVADTVPAGPPSIFFIIDHSSSMSTYNPTDSSGARYTATQAIIDSIAKLYPGAEVGLALFRSDLYFYPPDNPLFQPFPTFPTKSEKYSYLPLLKLDSLYGGITGLGVLKDLLRIENKGTYTDLVYERGDKEDIGGTNITAGFRAAKDGFIKAKAAPERQFIVFLSDGEANAPGGSNNVIQNEYLAGKGVPTTFTIYFNNKGTAPENLKTMTANIKGNGYSATNDSTKMTIISANYKSLFDVLLQGLVSAIKTTTITKTPTQLKINTQISTNYKDSSFTFASRFKFDPTYTPFKMQWSQQVTTDTGAGTTETKTINFTVKRVPNAVVPEKWTLSCWNRELGFFFKGQPITAAIDTMRELTIRFKTDRAAEYGAVTVSIANIQGTKDNEQLTLAAGNDVWTKTFPSFISSSMTKNDGTFQHLGSDSIIAIFRNPSIPLDTLRLAIPIVESNKIKVSSIITRDTSGNGYLDAIDVTLAAGFSLPDNFALSNLQISYDGPDGKVVFVPVAITPIQNGNTLRIVLREDSATVREQLQTGWKPNVTINGLEYFLETTQSRPAGDGAGPVVQEAILSSGAMGTHYDTIQVKFSEPVNYAELTMAGRVNQIFNFYNKGALNNSILSNATILNGNDTMMTLLTPVGTSSVIPYQDYLQLITGTHDAANNAPPIITIARKEQIITVGENAIVIVTVNNPLNPANSNPTYLQARNQINIDYQGLNPSNEDGVLVHVITVKPLEITTGNLYGSAVVYDAVGNMVKDNLPLIKGPTYKDYGAFWNGANHSGRETGGGTYLMVISIRDIEGTRYVRKAKIGIKK
jgi:hypothetical protein